MATSVDIPEGLENRMKEKLDEGLYSSKAELIRSALRKFLKTEEELDARQDAVIRLLREGRVEEKELSENTKRQLRKALSEEGGEALDS